MRSDNTIATKEPCALEALVPSDGNLAFSSDENGFLRDAFPMAEYDWQPSYRIPNPVDKDNLTLQRRGAVYLTGRNSSPHIEMGEIFVETTFLAAS